MKRSETTEQIHLFDWVRQWERYEPAMQLLYHVPNEGKRKNGAILKAMGLRPGVPDVALPYPDSFGRYHGLYIEMKYGENTPTQDQRDYMSMLRAAGYRVAVAYSADEAKEIIRDHLSRQDGFSLDACENIIGMDDTCKGTGRIRCDYCQYRKQ